MELKVGHFEHRCGQWAYIDPFEEDHEITEEDFVGSIETDYFYRGHEYTGIVIKTTFDDELFLRFSFQICKKQRFQNSGNFLRGLRPLFSISKEVLNEYLPSLLICSKGAGEIC